MAQVLADALSDVVTNERLDRHAAVQKADLERHAEAQRAALHRHTAAQKADLERLETRLEEKIDTAIAGVKSEFKAFQRPLAALHT